MASIQSAIEDEYGDVARLAIANLLQTVAYNEILPCGAIIAIKEPYFACIGYGGTVEAQSCERSPFGLRLTQAKQRYYSDKTRASYHRGRPVSARLERQG